MGMRLLAGVAIIALLALSAAAENNISFYLGGAHTRNSSLTLHDSAENQLTFADLPFQGRSFESPLYYGGRLGHFFFRHFGVETEFIHLKMYANTAVPVR